MALPTRFDTTIDLTLDLLKAINEARPDSTIAQAEVFLALVMLAGDADRVVTQEDLGVHLRRPQGPISKQIDKWIEAGLLTKEFVPGSQLYRQYPLTAKGKALLTKLRQIIDRAKAKE